MHQHKSTFLKTFLYVLCITLTILPFKLLLQSSALARTTDVPDGTYIGSMRDYKSNDSEKSIDFAVIVSNEHITIFSDFTDPLVKDYLKSFALKKRIISYQNGKLIYKREIIFVSGGKGHPIIKKSKLKAQN